MKHYLLKLKTCFCFSMETRRRKVNGPEEAVTLPSMEPQMNRFGRQINPICVFVMVLKEANLTWPAVGLSQLSHTATTRSPLMNRHFTAVISTPQNTLISGGIDFSKDGSHNVLLWPQATIIPAVLEKNITKQLLLFSSSSLNTSSDTIIPKTQQSLCVCISFICCFNVVVGGK